MKNLTPAGASILGCRGKPTGRRRDPSLAQSHDRKAARLVSSPFGEEVCRAAEGGSLYERVGAARRPKAFPAHGEGAPVRTLGRMRSPRSELWIQLGRVRWDEESSLCPILMTHPVHYSLYST